jgi:FAD/FMN-containing dehydrogenase
MSDQRYQSWGRYPKVSQTAAGYYWRNEALPTGMFAGKSFLPFGNGRSYGDVCLNDGGYILDCRGLNRFIRFDTETGVLRCEAGVLLSEVLALIVPRGWFLPVTPGTQLVTLGGAIANDVHGKNHHRAGTIGCHVHCLELLRSDGSRMYCSPDENPDWFGATIGGMGLTGVITWAEIQLVPINNPFINQELICYDSLHDFFILARESDRQFEHTVAWVDCLARGASLGRGIYIRGNYARHPGLSTAGPPKHRLGVPLDPPFSLLNKAVLKLFNGTYYHGHRLLVRKQKLVHYEPFFYPLDAISSWNRIYGSSGFMQYQCVVPENHAEAAINEILGIISRAGTGSFLCVLKVFGARPSPGMLSFPRAGATLALDFPNHGDKTLQLLDRLDDVTRSAGGAVYPAKDARMSATDFRYYYPDWEALLPFIDPCISSSFWRRVTADAS